MSVSLVITIAMVTCFELLTRHRDPRRVPSGVVFDTFVRTDSKRTATRRRSHIDPWGSGWRRESNE